MNTLAHSPAKILIVEDEIIVAMEIQDLLEAAAYSVVGVAATGEDAVLKFAGAGPDLVLMDITLRGAMSGIEAAEKILDQRRVPILFLTAAENPAVIHKIRDLTICGFIPKPFEETAFLKEIGDTLQAFRAASFPSGQLEE